MAEETVTPGGEVIAQGSFYYHTEDNLPDDLLPFLVIAQYAELELIPHYLPDQVLLLSSENPSQTTTPIQQAGS